MPLVALLLNLNKMTSIGVFDKYEHFKSYVIEKLINPEYIKSIGLHPLQVLIYMKTYSSGIGYKGNSTWEPIPELVTAMNKCFKLSFANVTSTDKRYFIGLDISGSMTSKGNVSGIESMTASEISCAMAMIISKSEPKCDIMGFSTELKALDIKFDEGLEKNITKIYNNTFGMTDISAPFIWAKTQNKAYDVFIIITDNKTNTNTINPIDAFREYRTNMNIDSKLIIISTSANKFSIADPNDIGMMDITGFDGDTPRIIQDFVNGWR